LITTRTGGFPLGFRRGWSDFFKDLAALIVWTKQQQIGVIDVGSDVAAIQQVRAAGLQVGTADMKHMGKLMSPDAAVRTAAVAESIDYVQAGVAAGAKNFFICMLPEKPERKRSENFIDLVESLKVLAPAMEKLGASLAIEGYPGNGALVTTPEGYRRLFKEVPSPAVGINYDPSHLVRMGIDPLRFLKEFSARVRHVHGKDTMVLAEDVYEYGTEVPATFAPGHGFGSSAWRYTIPGHGQVPWVAVFDVLKRAGYPGAVSIELEDENFNGTTEGEKLGILSGIRYLSTT
jgi:sugar phosphate isomerase/epimerase